MNQTSKPLSSFGVNWDVHRDCMQRHEEKIRAQDRERQLQRTEYYAAIRRMDEREEGEKQKKVRNNKSYGVELREQRAKDRARLQAEHAARYQVCGTHFGPNEPECGFFEEIKRQNQKVIASHIEDQLLQQARTRQLQREVEMQRAHEQLA